MTRPHLTSPFLPPDDEPLTDCPRCGGSGFEGQGTGYDSVCSECGGQRQMPARFCQEVNT